MRNLEFNSRILYATRAEGVAAMPGSGEHADADRAADAYRDDQEDIDGS